MPFDPARHHRRSIRLAGHDYTLAGAYYVTICAATRGPIFGRGRGGSIILNAIGQIVQDAWMSLPEHYPHVGLDAFVVMPDHVHGIVVFADVPPAGDGGDDGDDGDDGGAQRAAPLRVPSSATPPSPATPPSSAIAPIASSAIAPIASSPIAPNVMPGSLGVIVRAFKSAATREINCRRGTPGARVWQRNYYEHIVRDMADLERIRRYIAANPGRWRA